MRGFLLLWRREVGASLTSFGFWAILAAVSAFTAWVYRSALLASYGDLDRALSSSFGWLFFVTAIVSPLLTMRLLAEERHSGSFELLFTAPVSEAQVVLAKYASALAIFLVYLVPIWIVHFILARFFDSEPDWGQLTAMSIGLVALALVFLAVGLLASAATSSQLWAALLGIMGIAALWAAGMAHTLLDPDSNLAAVLRAGSLYIHVGTAAAGIVDVRHLVFAGSLTGLILFWTVRLLESRRWA